MDMTQVRHFLAVTETLNFTKAADLCDVSQPTLTRSVKAIEAELGGELLRREGRSTHLTELGERMLPFLRRAHESALMARELARAVSENEIAPLTLAISHSVSIETFLDTLAPLYAKFPGLQLKITHGSARAVIEQLKEGRADIALAGPLDDGWARLEQWGLFEEGFSVVTLSDHPLAQRPAVSLGELGDTPLFLQVGCEVKEQFAELLSQTIETYRGSNDIDQAAGLPALLAAANGVAISPDSLPMESQLVRIPLRGVELKRRVSAYTAAGRPRSLSASTFLSQLRTKTFSTEPAMAEASQHRSAF